MPLTATDIERIDAASLRILAEIGIRVDDAALRDLAIGAGAKSGSAADRVLLPAEMVRESVAMAPAEARFADASGRVTALSPGGAVTFWTGAALNYAAGGKHRAICGDDLAEFARIADRLESVFAVVGTSVEDVPPPARDVVGMRILAENTGKHLRPLLFTAAGVKPIIEMAEIIADGRALSGCPLVSFGYSCLSPLHWAQITIDLWRESGGRGIPVMLNGEPIAGATSPVTLAGSIAQSNAEILAGVVFTQLLEPGRPVVHNLGFAHTTDMHTGACLSASAECAMMACAGAQLAAHYELPSASWMCTESHTDDAQASMEKALTGLAHAAAGVNIIWGMGQLASQKALSPVQLVIDDEIARWAIRFRKGVTVDDEALAMGAVADVAAGREDFLAHPHTLERFRDELSESDLLMRDSLDAWQAGGSKTLTELATERAKALSAEREPTLTDDQRREVRAVERRHAERLA